MISNWIGWMLSIIVFILLFGIGAVLKNPVRLVITGKRAEGRVVGVDTLSSSYDQLGENLLRVPVIEFVTVKGKLIHFRGNDATNLKPMRIGETIQVAYDPLNPEDFQIMRWKESPLIPVGVLLGFIAFILLIWMVGISMTEDSRLDDPFHLLPKVLATHQTLPYIFIGVMGVLFIFVCIAVTFTLSKQSWVLASTGIRAQGVVVYMTDETSRLESGGTASGTYPHIKFRDESGKEHTIRRSLSKPYSRLKIGDVVEVIYPSNYPDSAVVNTWDELYLVQSFWGFFSFMFLLLAFFIIRAMMRS